MDNLNDILAQYREIERIIAVMLMEVHEKITEMEKLKRNETEMKKETSGLHNDIYVPFAAYEMQEERHHESFEAQEARNMEERQKLMDRHDAELDKVRKHYKNIVMFITIPFATLIVAIFATVIWFFGSYDFASYNQDGDGINNYLNSSSQGDVTYEPIYPGDYLEESLQGEGGLDK